MKLNFKIPILLLIFIVQSTVLIGQEMESARYSVTSNALLDMIEKYPDKKESIEKSIISNSPKYVDFILINDELVQVYWNYQNNLMGIKIYSKDKIYSISTENELLTENRNLETDSIQFNRIEIKNDSINKYELNEKGAVPLTVILKDSLNNDNFIQSTNFNDYPEVSIVTDFKIFPMKYIFGKPKIFMSFDFFKELELELFESKKEYSEFIADIGSKEKRQLLIDKVSE